MRLVLWRLIGVVVVVLAAFGSFSLAWMLVDHAPPIQYISARALKPTVPQGGTIEVEFEVVRDRRCELSVRRILTDSAGSQHTIPTYTVGFPTELGRERYERQITVPDSAALGLASYRVTLSYTCNLLQQILGLPIVIEAPPVTFDITARSRWLLPTKARRVLADG